MRAWFLADLHFGCRADNEIWLKDYSDYFYNVFLPLLKKEYKEGDIICSLGDVFDNRSTIGINTINIVIDIFEKMADICPDIRLIVGNHDIYNKSTNDVTSLNVLKYIKGVKIYPMSEKIAHGVGHGRKITPKVVACHGYELVVGYFFFVYVKLKVAKTGYVDYGRFGIFLYIKAASEHRYRHRLARSYPNGFFKSIFHRFDFISKWDLFFRI